ncbi:unnamed protein product [Microthlaspi erraticum]|uniref:RING-type domain-containing protein n=1 Tax=Microthlaspi erraticum TaxID=1685480 RepID=A0A6D2IHR3_9BRAS|nr:unnamed protein product [Microthlaspi erraticum]
MQETVSDDLIHFGINFGFALFFFGIACVLVACIIKCYKNDDIHYHHDHETSNDHVIITIVERPGIEPSVLRSIPVVDFSSRDSKDGVECVVCLSNLVDGDKARLLPSCDHWFHAGCIDSWLRSHTNCPICRKRVGSVQRGPRPELQGDESLTRNHDRSSEHPRFPTVTDTPPVTDAAVVDDCSESDVVRSDLTAVAAEIPAKRIES